MHVLNFYQQIRLMFNNIILAFIWKFTATSNYNSCCGKTPSTKQLLIQKW